MSPAEITPTVDADDTVLIFADLQPELVAKSRTRSANGISAAAAALAGAAGLFGLPMLFTVVGVDGKAPSHLPAIAEHAGAVNSFTRRHARPFADEDFTAALAATGRRTLVVAGYSAEAVIQYLALDGIANGYRVAVALEGVGARSARVEAAALRRIERAGAIVTSVADILQSAEGALTGVRGKACFAIVHEFMGADG